MVTIKRYTAEDKPLWDSFVKTSKNGTFLFLRDYMDYHADRFLDHSLLLTDKNDKLIALLPANETEQSDGEKTIHSHQGLTYGGLIYNERMHMETVIEVLQAVGRYYKTEGAKRLIYKPVPHIYHRIPAEEDLYAIFKLYDAKLIARNISSAIDLTTPLAWSENRRRNARKALQAGIIVERSSDYPAFWSILSDNLLHTYGATPVHSIEEMRKLSNSMGEHIQLYMALSQDRTPLAGTVLYISKGVLHTQYISASPEGKSLHALDAVFYYLLHEKLPASDHHYRYFDFGTSNEQGGHYLNESLIHQKQGFGARGIVYDTYEIKLCNNT